MANRRFGWHSGALTCRDLIINNDITISGDMTFGDASADSLTVTGTSTFNADVTFNDDVTMTWASDDEDLVITKSDSTGTAGTGGYGIKYTGTFTADAASAHKGIFSQVNYEPPSDDGTACSIAIEGQVTATGDLTESNNYPGYGYGLQGRFHLLNGATIVSGDLDPGSTYAGVRAVLTDTGSATLTKGTFTALMAECQISQDADNTNFRTYLGWFRCQGSTTSTDITAAIRIESGDAWGNNIQKGISMRDFVSAIHLEAADSSYVFNIDAESGCVDGTNGTYTTADGYLKCLINDTDVRIPYYAGVDD